MAYSKFSRLLISLVVVLGNIPNAHAQGTNQYGGGGSYATRPGGFYGSGDWLEPLQRGVPDAGWEL